MSSSYSKEAIDGMIAMAGKTFLSSQKRLDVAIDAFDKNNEYKDYC